ncbi:MULTISPECIES: Rv0361 family membrane protein [unclassified Micromonospora]|uniref:Rv0361 family membrane protein n=1 Tax=unclassified Micromonospora TaxID=2617518 RepID=UPI002FF23C7E
MTQPPNDGLTGAPDTPAPDTTGPASPDGPGPGAIPPPPAAYPAYQAPVAKRRRGLLVVSLVLAAAVLLCGGGGTAAFLALRDTEDGEGAKEPAVAVENFLTAVYRDRDAKKAAQHVCSDARDQDKLDAKVAEVQKYAAGYANPRFRWASPKVDNQNGDRATVSTKVTMTTADEKVAEQALRFTVVRKTGWWVCEVA